VPGPVLVAPQGGDHHLTGRHGPDHARIAGGVGDLAHLLVQGLRLGEPTGEDLRFGAGAQRQRQDDQLAEGTDRSQVPIGERVVRPVVPQLDGPIQGQLQDGARLVGGERLEGPAEDGGGGRMGTSGVCASLINR